ncbi:MAG: hypothetical protein A2Y17_08490 [Clostridiales bacterium GWF2_38_85]|nr:MAG: hypothetical protein A2Y17_08490 [Clostridiales bacterium GWF2_38_85]HBL83769.1 hypothetical protein [Clostridiales bacterium]
MKICKDKDINYDAMGITEENGWKVSYDYSKLKKVFNFIFFTIWIITIALTLIFKNNIVSEYGKTNFLLCCFILVLVFIVVLTPIHELLHLIIFADFKIDDKCCIVISSRAVSAFYKGEVTASQLQKSLITPLIIIGIVLVIISIFVSGIYRFSALFLLYLHILGCYTDIYMFFYYKKRFKKDVIFYGNRYLD